MGIIHLFLISKPYKYIITTRKMLCLSIRGMYVIDDKREAV